MVHERVHLRASLRWNTSRLELAVIHLPSNRYAGSADAGDAARIGELEQALAQPPRPDLVVGDMNCRPDSLPYRFVSGSGYVDAAAVTGGDAVRERGVDYVWLDERCADRLAAFAVLDSGSFCRTTPEGEAWRLSDHPPLLIELR